MLHCPEHCERTKVRDSEIAVETAWAARCLQAASQTPSAASMGTKCGQGMPRPWVKWSRQTPSAKADSLLTAAHTEPVLVHG